MIPVSAERMLTWRTERARLTRYTGDGIGATAARSPALVRLSRQLTTLGRPSRNCFNSVKSRRFSIFPAVTSTGCNSSPCQNGISAPTSSGNLLKRINRGMQIRIGNSCDSTSLPTRCRMRISCSAETAWCTCALMTSLQR